MNKVVFVTGASSGIGEAFVKECLRENYTVYGGARRIERMRALEEQGAHILCLDVTDEASLVDAVRRVMEEQGRIDILVNNAGYGLAGALETVPLDDVRHQFEVNVFGLMRLTQLVLPIMRKQRSGRIMNVSSIAGKCYFPMSGWYSASKYSLEVLSDVLRNEVERWGVQVVVIEPGFVLTDCPTVGEEAAVKYAKGTDYESRAEDHSRVIQKIMRSTAVSPEYVAQKMFRIMRSSKPKTRYLIGRAIRLPALLKRIVSDRLFDKLLRLRIRLIR